MNIPHIMLTEASNDDATHRLPANKLISETAGEVWYVSISVEKFGVTLPCLLIDFIGTSLLVENRVSRNSNYFTMLQEN